MPPVPSSALLRSLRAWPSSLVCGHCLRQARVHGFRLHLDQARRLKSNITSVPITKAPASLRKQLKEESKARKNANGPSTQQSKKGSEARSNPRLEKWELTVGIEVHAELNTARKLFSGARTSLSDTPNTHAAPFDIALPGTQPQFQHETLLPALRAALALGCEIQPESSWDRKHYFWWDQPNGYQITQYYQPFARGGSLTLFPHDDIDVVDHPSITVGIKQIQMEQDTAKTVLQPPATYMLDFNRASHPLIEVITMPHIHSPKTAAALVKKLQGILQAVGANTTGMEMGGLRADVNVSVKLRGGPEGTCEYDGVKGLGQRTEIKNLSSFKAVEDAIVAERDRQISVLERGGVVEGETRGWTLGSTETKRLRGKEGEVDYRYMPDPDLAPVRIGDDLVDHLRDTLPTLPDQDLKTLTEGERYGLTPKDARTLIELENGDRLDFYYDVVERVREQVGRGSEAWSKAGKTVANWTIMELPSFVAATGTPFPYHDNGDLSSYANGQSILTPATVAAIILHVLSSEMTLPTARKILSMCVAPPALPAIVDWQSENTAAFAAIAGLLDKHNLRLSPLSDAEYVALAEIIVSGNADMAQHVREMAERIGLQKARGKMMWFVGKMVRESDEGKEGRVQPERAEAAVRSALGLMEA